MENNNSNTRIKTDDENYQLAAIGHNILYTSYFDAADVDLNKIKEIIDAGLDLMARAPFYSFVDMSDVFGDMTNEAKKHVAKSQLLAELKIGEALIVNSLGMKLLIQGYLKIFKPLTRIKVFNNYESAIKWFKEIGATPKSINALNQFIDEKRLKSKPLHKS